MKMLSFFSYFLQIVWCSNFKFESASWISNLNPNLAKTPGHGRNSAKNKSKGKKKNVKCHSPPSRAVSSLLLDDTILESNLIIGSHFHDGYKWEEKKAAAGFWTWAHLWSEVSLTDFFQFPNNRFIPSQSSH